MKLNAIPADADFKQEIHRVLSAKTAPGQNEPASAAPIAALYAVYCFSRVSSTMDVARVIAAGSQREAFVEALIEGSGELAENGALVISAEQTAGRGRAGREWFSEAGSGLYVTFVFFPKEVAKHLPGFSVAIGLAVCRTLEQYGIQACVKWPNDVLTAEPAGGVRRKLAGILIESSSSGEVVKSLRVGVGLNLNQKAFPADIPAVSMAAVLGAEVPYAEVLSVLCAEVTLCTRRYCTHGFSVFAQEWYEKRVESDAGEMEILDVASR
jgi:biotin-[acetyl-CoA-carboxylase] ligase BirA-like protein